MQAIVSAIYLCYGGPVWLTAIPHSLLRVANELLERAEEDRARHEFEIRNAVREAANCECHDIWMRERDEGVVLFVTSLYIWKMFYSLDFLCRKLICLVFYLGNVSFTWLISQLQVLIPGIAGSRKNKINKTNIIIIDSLSCCQPQHLEVDVVKYEMGDMKCWLFHWCLLSDVFVIGCGHDDGIDGCDRLYVISWFISTVPHIFTFLQFYPFYPHTSIPSLIANKFLYIL